MLAALKYDVSGRRTDGLETNQQFNQMIQTSLFAYLSYSNNYSCKKLDAPCDSSASCINEPSNQWRCCNIRQTLWKMRILQAFAFYIKQHKSSSVTSFCNVATTQCSHCYIDAETVWCAAVLIITRCATTVSTAGGRWISEVNLEALTNSLDDHFTVFFLPYIFV